MSGATRAVSAAHSASSRRPNASCSPAATSPSASPPSWSRGSPPELTRPSVRAFRPALRRSGLTKQSVGVSTSAADADLLGDGRKVVLGVTAGHLLADLRPAAGPEAGEITRDLDRARRR